MVTDRLMQGMGVALNLFLQGEEDPGHELGYVLLLTECDHSGDEGDLTPVQMLAHNLDRNDAARLLRAMADRIERTEH